MLLRCICLQPCPIFQVTRLLCGVTSARRPLLIGHWNVGKGSRVSLGRRATASSEAASAARGA